MPREESTDLSGEDLEVEGNQRSVERRMPSDKVNRTPAPVAVSQHLDVDAVLERSLRKVAGE